MGTLGNKPATAFQALQKQSITGNAGTTYALDYAVANANDLEVFVNNVRQEPITAYTISGQNIVMSEAIASTDSFYVIYQAQSLQTIVPPDNSITQAMLQSGVGGSSYADADVDAHLLTAGVTLDATNDRVGIGTTAPTNNLTIVDGGATPYGADAEILLDIKRNTTNSGATNAVAIRLANNSNGFQIKYGGTSDTLNMAGGSANTMATFRNDGALTLPYQPAFGARNTTNATVWKGGYVYVNTGNHWNNTSGTFTAPVAGNYYFFGGGQSNGGGAFYWGFYKNGGQIYEFYNAMSGYTYGHASVAAVVPMVANDTLQFKQAGSVNMNTGGQNHFSGFLIG